ncbi:MAG: hypothetical protein IKX88_03610, partial [Thermoguttaceae bacterium]|nr:hypothetical protein [Thermoguttaceae bacterium]
IREPAKGHRSAVKPLGAKGKSLLRSVVLRVLSVSLNRRKKGEQNKRAQTRREYLKRARAIDNVLTLRKNHYAPLILFKTQTSVGAAVSAFITPF